jgi:glycosyltransferase involved in cell wall biosynthesis
MWQAVLRLAGDPDLRTRLGDAARQEIARRDYTWRGNARRVAEWGKKDSTQMKADARKTRK